MSRTRNGTAPLRFTLQILIAVLLVGLYAVPVAHAVQASGSIQLIPSQQIDLLKDQQITVDVNFVNNSTTTPPAAIMPNPATLTGPIIVNYACRDTSCDCQNKDLTRFSFVSCSVAGAPAGVVSCTDGGNGTAVINLAPGGLDLPASPTPLFLAKLTIKNNLDALPFTRFRASTDVCALSSCLTLGTDCATCAAEGCSFARGPQVVNELLSCKHGCPNRISFFNGFFDKLHFNALVRAPGYDPATDPLTLTLSNGGQIFTVTIPSVPQTGPRAWSLNGPGSKTTAGIDLVRITARTGVGEGGVDCTDSWFKVIVDVWADFTAAQTVNPVLTVDLDLGGQVFTNTEPWTSIPPNAVGADITAIENDMDVRSPC